MSICLLALVILGILSVFSARYRKWAREALDCVSRRVILRPCKTGFNQKVRAKITSKLMGKSTGLARFTHKHFEALSWVFTVMLFVSLVVTAVSAYNLAVYGSCDPGSGACVFNPGAEEICGNPNCTGCGTTEISCGPECCPGGECG